MVTINVVNIEGKATLPIHGDGKSESFAAGYDIVAADDPIVVGDVGDEQTLPDGTKIPLYKNIQYLEYRTAIKTQPLWNGSDYHHLDLHTRSSVRKYNLLLANSVGVIDNDYRGEILVCFKYVFQPEDFVFNIIPDGDKGDYKFSGLLAGINWTKIYRKGDKIAQLIAEKTNECNYVFVPELTATVRGEGGHGSTGQTVIQTPTTTGGGTLSELYSKATGGTGIPIKKRYSDEMHERERVEGRPQAGTGFVPQPGIHERTGKR